MMKKLTNHTKLLVLLLLVVVTSCRKEETELIQEPEDTLETDSTVALRILQTVTKDGSIDNILDRANCISIKYPVTVTANAIQLVVNNTDDLRTIEAIFDDEDDDVNSLDFQFPILVELTDYTEVTVNSLQELTQLANTCLGENIADDDIECLDFIYPITAAVFNTSNELIETLTFTGDSPLYNFINTLEPSEIVAINFPVSVQLQDGTLITTASLTELQTTIDTYVNSCDEDDDYDFEDDDCNTCTPEQLKDALVNCNDWIVKDLERDAVNYDDFYDNYIFNFFEDNTVISQWNGTSATGTWTADGSGNNITVVINIPGLALCNNTWRLHEIQEYNDETKIDFRVGSIDRLRYVKNCNDTANNLETILADGLWIVASYIENTDDQTSDYTGYQLNFDASGTVVADNGANPNNGTWSVLNNDTTMTLDFGAAIPFSEFNDDDWNIISFTNTQVIIQDVSGGGGGTDTLTLEKI